jgi:Protein of unknown function (DUF4232)
MKQPSGRIARRIAFAVALAGLAAGGVGAASAAAGAPSAAARVPGCLTSQVTVWVGVPGGATAGSTYYELEFSDTSTAACSLSGFPGVSAITAAGAQLGSPAGWDHSSTPHTVILTPGETAHTVLQIADVANYPSGTCKPANAAGLRIYPPNQRASRTVAFPFRACGKAGPVYLNVAPIVAGTGIPGYSE